MAGDSFYRLGDAIPAGPVVVSVPHAGRDYPDVLSAALRVPAGALMALEDRFVDAVATAARGVCTTFVANRARAWIDLNRGEDERDPRVDDGAPGHAQALRSAKVRSGLGLVPRRGAGPADLWRERFTAADVEARIRADHRPYHAALAAALAAARARFGVAVLLDLHSMPPLASASAAACGPRTGRGPRIVIGDRFGGSAGARFVARVESAVASERTAINVPYAGGYILERHGAPARGVHAVQLELDRTLYLDSALDRPGPGLGHAARLVAGAIAALEDEAMGLPSLAAE